MAKVEFDERLIEASSPVQELLGYHLTGWSEGYARLEMPLAEKHGNRQGLPHGGVYATMLDTTMGYAGCFTGDPDRKQLALTLSMTINFVGRPAGKLLICEGRWIGGGKSTFFTEGSLKDETGVLVATGTGTFRYRTPR